MKILLNCHTPFQLAHGGSQVQIENTKIALEKIGVEVEFLRWWDETQTGDILHQVGGVDAALVSRARAKGWKVALNLLLTETCNRTMRQLLARKLMIRAALAAPLPRQAKDQLPWAIFHRADKMIVGLEAERMILENIYGIPHAKTAVVPLGLAEPYLNAGPASRTENHLICTGTIGPSKNSLPLARLAQEAQTPLLFVGKPFNFDSDYWRDFQKLIDGKFVKHHPHVGTQTELIELLQRARGFVLMSRFENWSLATHEAAGCGLPLLLPDQRWSRERFGAEASYWPAKDHAAQVNALKKFYADCPRLAKPAVKLFSWVEAAEQLRIIYAQMLGQTVPA
jgi:glycosyltransferase involved in cell wall biosynthesis